MWDSWTGRVRRRVPPLHTLVMQRDQASVGDRAPPMEVQETLALLAHATSFGSSPALSDSGRPREYLSRTQLHRSPAQSCPEATRGASNAGKLSADQAGFALRFL